MVAAAAAYLAFTNPSLNHPNPSKAVTLLTNFTTYSLTSLNNVAKLISKKVSEEPVTASRRQLIAVKKKFANEKYGAISEEEHPVLKDNEEGEESDS